MPDYPDLEPSRQKALDRITDAFAGGAITIEDYEERAGRIQKAIRVDDISGCLSDLPRDPLPRDPLPGRTPKAPRSSGNGYAPAYRERPSFSVEAKTGRNEDIACIMGDRRMTGDWLNSDKVSSFTLMGSTTLDLRHTPLPPGRLRIDAFTLMGEIRVIVPRGLPVKLSAFPFMGDARMADNVERRIVRDEPYVEISGFAMMGSIVVRSAD